MSEPRFNAEGCFIAVIGMLVLVFFALLVLAFGSIILIMWTQYGPEFNIVFPSIVIDKAFFDPLTDLGAFLIPQVFVAMFVAIGVNMLLDDVVGKDGFIKAMGWLTIVGAILISSMYYAGAFNG